MNTKSQRILMATDIPFWNAKTGAEQRMASLARFFNQDPFEFAVFFLGKVTAADHQLITSQKLNVTFFESEKPPAAFLDRMKWYADATRNQLQKWITRDKSTISSEVETPLPLTLADYKWPWAVDQFRRQIVRFRPQVIIAQYVTMAYLIEGLTQKERREIHCVLDTHDILHERGMQFGAAGYLHWLEIEPAEEIRIWNLFDTVLAIQENEAELIRSCVQGPKVMTIGHAPQVELDEGSHNANIHSADTESSGPVTIGYIGSPNYSNWHAINRFLIEVWPDLLAMENSQVQLVIAGKICDWFNLLEPKRVASLAESHVHLLGEVRSLHEFYSQIDIAINPVQFGTGLKIKNVEALAYGKPLVTTASGALGMSPAAREHCIVVPDFRTMSEELQRLARNPARRQELAKAAFSHAKLEYSSDSAYAELAKQLL